MPSSRSNSQERFCCAISRRCRRLASRATTPCRLRELLVEIGAQPVELLGLAEILGGDGLVELGGEGLVVRTRAARSAPESARPLRLARRLGVAHVGVVGHLGGRRFGRFGRRPRHRPRRRPAILRTSSARMSLGLGGVALLAGLVLRLLVLVALARRPPRRRSELLAHVERVEQVAHGVGERRWSSSRSSSRSRSRAGALLDQRPPQLDDACARRRRRLRR